MIKYLCFLLGISITLCFNPLPDKNGKLNSNYSHKSTNNLYFVFEHFRHGARSTCNGKFVNHKDELGGIWKNFGSLTQVGIKQHYLLGKKLRKYYDNFISKEYNPNEIKIYSSNYNRTIMSAQSQLLGFYDNYDLESKIKNDDIINEDNIQNNFELNNIIPPILLFDNKYDITFTEKFRCKLPKTMVKKNIKYIETLKSFDKLNDIRNRFNNKYMDIISNEFKAINYTNNFFGMYKFCDMFIAFFFDNGINKKKINDIEKKHKIFNTSEILDICYDYFHEKFFKVEGEEFAENSSKIIMSRILMKLLNAMKERVEINDQNYISPKSPKMVFYSGHDDTLTQLQLFLNKYFKINTEWVPYASNQIFELRKYGDTFYVELYYNDRLKMNITFNQFSKRINQYTLPNFHINYLCYGFRNTIYYNKIFILYILLIILLFFYIATKIIIYIRIDDYADKPSDNSLMS